MLFKKLYPIIKPIVSRNALLRKLVVIVGKRCVFIPKVLTIVLTYRCQCHCFHCGVSNFKKSNYEELTTEEITNLIEQAKDLHSIAQITFTGGEPLIHKDIFDLVEYSKNRGFFIKIDTNAALLDRSVMTKLKYAGLDRVGISLDHYQEDKHDGLRRLKGLFNKVIDAVHLCHEFNISCYLQTYVTRYNLKNGDLEKTIDLAKKLRVEKIKIQAPALLGSFKDNTDFALTHEDFILLDKIISRHRFAYVESEFYSPRQYRDFCKVGFKTNIHVTSNGDVQPCCWFPVSFGNIRNNSLSDILRQMYKNNEFKKLTSYDGCLCSNPQVLSQYLGDANDLPVKMY